MSFSIPAQIEKDIISGRAQYRTFQTGNGGQSILQVPTNSYAVIYGYDFSPAGGGIRRQEVNSFVENANLLTNAALRFFETQQITFYTGSDFFPFIHHVNMVTTMVPRSQLIDGTVLNTFVINEIDNSPISRQVYITSNKDVTITHGLILSGIVATTGVIPVTSRTPGFLTYGGSVQNVQAQTNYGPFGNPQEFMQPTPKDFEDFNFGLLPNNPNDQAFASPDVTNGLLEANELLTGLGGTAFSEAAAANYFLCLHYALYTEVVPEQRG